MEITKFLNKHNIKWAYITLNDEFSCPQYYRTQERYNYNDFYDNDKWEGNQELVQDDRIRILNNNRKIDKYRDSNKEKYDLYKRNNVYIAYSLQNMCVIDVDNEERFNYQYDNLKNVLNNTFRYKSRSKRFMHYIVSMDINEPRVVFKDNDGEEVGDILNKQAPWCRIDEIVEGNMFAPLNIDMFITNYVPKKKNIQNTQNIQKLKTFKTSSFDTSEIDGLLSILNLNYWDEFQTWINIGLSLKGLYGEIGYNLWDKYSMNSDKYDEDELQKQWDSFKIKSEKVSVRTIARYALASNRDAYYKWVVKYNKGYKFMLHDKQPFDKQFMKYLLSLCGDKFIYENQFSKEEKQETGIRKKKEIMQKYFDKNSMLVLSYICQYTCMIHGSSMMYVKHDYNEYKDLCNPTIFKGEKEFKNLFE